MAFVEKSEKDVILKNMMKEVEERIKEYQTSHKEEVKDELNSMIKSIEEALDGIEYAIDINSIRKTDTYRNIKELIKSLDS